MNKNGTTVGRNLRNVEIPAGLLILIVGVMEGGSLIGRIRLSLLQTVIELHAVLHDRILPLADVANRPVQGVAAAGNGALAQVNIILLIGIGSIIIGVGRIACEIQADIIAHGVHHAAIGSSLGDAAGDGGKGRVQLGLHIVILGNGKVAGSGVRGTAFQRVLAVSARLEGHGENGGASGLGLVGFPDGGYRMFNIHICLLCLSVRASQR